MNSIVVTAGKLTGSRGTIECRVPISGGYQCRIFDPSLTTWKGPVYTTVVLMEYEFKRVPDEAEAKSVKYGEFVL